MLEDPAHQLAAPSAEDVERAHQERLDQIRRLLQARDQHLPEPPLRSVEARQRKPGFAHRVKVRVSCEDCLANGRAVPGCETCGGRGYLDVSRRADPYDTGVSTAAFGHSGATAHEAREERDRQLDRLEAQLAPAPVSEADVLAELRPERWEIDRARSWASFDFAALDIALDRLRVADYPAYHAVHVALVYGWGDAPTELVERGLERLSGWLPEELRAPRRAAELTTADASGTL